MNTSQIAMAEKLGLGIKKYRDIEKEKIYPDAETLVSLIICQNIVLRYL